MVIIEQKIQSKLQYHFIYCCRHVIFNEWNRQILPQIYDHQFILSFNFVKIAN